MLAPVNLLLVLFLAAANASEVEPCPDAANTPNATRRSRAAGWFAKGEEATKLGDHLAAAHAFSCSMQLIPHAFTAFNLGRSAEHIGDLEMAIAAYEQYLLLAPDAADRQSVNDKLTSMREKLNQLTPPPDNVPPLEPTPPPPPPPVAKTPPKQQAPAVTTSAPAPLPPKEVKAAWKTAGWISLGGAAVFLAGGTTANLLARRQMDRCNSLYDAGNRSGAEDACAPAKPLAWTSYGLFAAGGVAAVTGALLLWLPRSPVDHVATLVLPSGGLGLQYQRRF